VRRTGTASEQTVHTISAACEVIWCGREAHDNDDDFSSERRLIPELIPRSRIGDAPVFHIPKYRGFVGGGIYTDHFSSPGRATGVSPCPSGKWLLNEITADLDTCSDVKTSMPDWPRGLGVDLETRQTVILRFPLWTREA